MRRIRVQERGEDKRKGEKERAKDIRKGGD